MSRVDLIIPTYNGSDLLRACLRSLASSTFTDYQLWVVDDGSSEDIRGLMASINPSAKVIRFEQNVGLARGLNVAIRQGDADYVVLLNNDTEVEEDWLAALVGCADEHPSAGSIASKMRLMSDRARLHSAGDYFSVRGMPGNRGVWMLDTGQYDDMRTTFSACGGAALYRRTALNDVALPNDQVFDERLFMYCEDVDLAWRLWRAGWECVFCPEALVFHALSATGGGTLASYYVSRNVWLVIARSIPAGVLPDWRRIAAYHLGRFLRDARHIRQPAARASLRGTLAGLWHAARDWRTRPRVSVQEQRRLRALLTDQRLRPGLPDAATLHESLASDDSAS